MGGCTGRRATWGFTHSVVVDVEDVDGVFLGQLCICLTPTMTSLPESMRACFVGGAGFDLHLGPAGFDGLVMPPMASISG